VRVLRPEAILVCLLLATPAFASELSITNAWFRAMPANLPAAGYFKLHNGGPKSVELTGATSPACGMLMLHKSTMSGGMSQMSDVESIAIPAGTTLSFQPGGYHLMCMSPSLHPGGKAVVELQFVDGRTLAAAFAVKNAKGH